MMKRVFSLVLVLVMLFSMTTFVQADAHEVKITIAHTNDTHARIEEGKYAGMGFAKMATKVKELRAANPNFLLLDAGDTFHGQTIATLVKGESVVKSMNEMGYDAMAAGNHDFNYGQERLLELNEMTNFPIMGANVMKGEEVFLPEYIIKEVGGVKFGIFGLASPETAYKTHPNNVKGIVFADPVATAQKMVDMLKDQTDVIIALAHIGIDEETIVKSTDIATKVDGIDLIIDGHSHTDLEKGMVVNGTTIVQAGEYDKNMGIVELVVTDKKVSSITASLLTKDAAADIVADPAVQAVIDEVKAANEVITSVKVGDATINLDGERGQVRTGETNLGNYITDAMLDETGAQIAITNGGGIRASITPGEVTKGDVITVLPFGNFIVTKDLKGSDIKAAIEHGIDSYPGAKGAFPHVAGLTYKFDPNMEVGNKITEIMVNGVALDMDKMYEVATNDFMAAGGDGYTMFGDDAVKGEFAALDEAVINYMAKVSMDTAKTEMRIVAYDAPVYTIMADDVLWRIAKKYGVTWQDLATYNKLDNPNMIFPGNTLMIPAK